MLAHLGAPMFARGYVLVANQLLSAGLGLLYWAVAARIASAAQVGVAATTISAIALLSMISELGVKSALVRFTPALGQRFRPFVLACYACNIAASLAVMLVVALFHDRDWMRPVCGEACSWQVWAVIALTLFYVQDGVLTGLKRAWIVLLGSFAYNALKLALLIILAARGDERAILISWFAPLPFLVLAANALIFLRRWPAQSRIEEPADYRSMASLTAWGYFGGLVNEASVRLLPILVFWRLGAASAAYFFQAWLIASALRLLVTSHTMSFTVEVAADPHTLQLNSRRALINLVGVTLLGAVGLAVAAPYLLAFLGPDYAANGAGPFRLLALAAVPYAVSMWFGAHSQLVGAGRRILVNHALQGGASLALAFLLIGPFGLVGVGAACLLGQLIALAPTWPTFRDVVFARDDARPRKQDRSRAAVTNWSGAEPRIRQQETH